MTKPTRPILCYHGGKWLLAPWISSHFPPHKCYTETLGGGGSVLLRKSRSYAEVYNDRWDLVTNLFSVIRDETKAAELKRVLELTPFSRTEFERAAKALKDTSISDIEKARLTILRSFAGFGSASTNPKHSTGFRSCSTRSGSTPAHDFMNYPKQIELFTQRLRGVIVENRDYWQVMKTHDAPTTLHYLDPPYVQSTRNLVRKNAMYEFEFTDDDHRAMVQRCDQMKGMIIISGYNSPLYNEILAHWEKVEKPTHADGARDRIECLWLNPACAAAQPQKILAL